MCDIQVLVSKLVAKAPQLLGNETTNVAECWMHIRSKFDGGKVINRSQSGSWEYRCMGAGLQQNLGKEWGPIVWSSMTNSLANQHFIDTARSSAKKADNDRKRKATDKAKQQRRQSKYSRNDDTAAAKKSYSRHDDGIQPDEVTDDVPVQLLADMKQAFYQTKVVVTEAEAANLEQCTQGQAASEKWSSERRKRLTASKVGSISKMKATTKRSKKVKQLLYNTFRGNVATRYGMKLEQKTKQEYLTHQQCMGHPGLTVYSAGLFVSPTNPWMAASPDGLVQDPTHATDPQGLVEIKNPYSVRDKSLGEACTTSSFCLESQAQEDGKVTYKLKTKHDYYYQMQCQMYCTDRNWCDFVLRTNKELHVQCIYRDRRWWDGQLPTLRSFYFDALLPELACPRQGKGGIREPDFTPQ